jgi:predicted PolB exonuclease-like 3'-5' exonuclease
MTATSDPAYLVFDVETVPDGVLIAKVKFPGESITPLDAVARARREALERTEGKSDFLPPSFLYPVAVCVARVREDYSLESITCLDAPKFRPREIAAAFWRGLARYHCPLVSFNGRSFDLPVLEMAAFRWGLTAPGHFEEKFGRRYRYGTAHLDLADWLSNHGAAPVAGGLNLLSKLLGKPGKMQTTGADVYDLHLAGKIQKINDYCMFDVLDTYFVFLRSRVMTGDLSAEREHECVLSARKWIESQLKKLPHLQIYLDNWGDWEPWI